jgi:hypothetical protein
MPDHFHLTTFFAAHQAAIPLGMTDFEFRDGQN